MAPILDMSAFRTQLASLAGACLLIALACVGPHASSGDGEGGTGEDGGDESGAAYCVESQPLLASRDDDHSSLHCDHDEGDAAGLPVCLPRQGVYASAMCGADVVDRFAIDVPYKWAILEFELNYTHGGPPWRLQGAVDGPNEMGFDSELSSGGRVIWLGDVERLWLSLSSEGHHPDASYELLVDVRPDPRAAAACKALPLGASCSFKVMNSQYAGTCLGNAGQVWCGT